MTTLANSIDERTAFLNLLTEYFYSRQASPQPQPTPSTSRRPTPTIPTTSQPTAAVPEQFNVDSIIATGSTKMANSALQNQTLTTGALTNAGLPPAQAKLLSKFGSKHSEIVAPHLARAGVASVKAQLNGAPPKGPVKPAGLSSGKSFGAISFNNGKDFRSTLVKADGPMSKEAAAKKRAEIPPSLALRQNSTNTDATPASWVRGAGTSAPVPLAPPPQRAPELMGLGKARAEFAYASVEPDDLPLDEGDVVVVVEHSTLFRCRYRALADSL